MRLEGKVALISGGARGMGAVEAKLFAKEGAKVVLGDILGTEGKKVASDINESGGQAFYVSLDVTNEDDWIRAVSAAVQRYGKLDILVNNAGVRGSLVHLTEISGDEWDQVMAINAKGVFLGMKYSIPELQKRGGGSIVNISSLVGIVGSKGRNAAYDASKGATRVLTKTAALTYAKDHIRVNSVHPGPILTPMTEDSYPDEQTFERSGRQIPLGRIGAPEDVAYAVLLLASDESSYMTGSELVVDGGILAQ